MLQLKKTALSNHIIQTQECSFLLAKSIRHSLLHSKTELQKKKNKEEDKSTKEGTFDGDKYWAWAQWETNLIYGGSIAYTSTCTWMNTLRCSKMILLSNQHYWKDSPTAVHKVYSRSSICLKHNPGKAFHLSHGHFQLSLGPFEECRLYFTQMLPFQG